MSTVCEGCRGQVPAGARTCRSCGRIQPGWAVCEVDCWRGYFYGEFVAIQDHTTVVARSGGFRWPRREEAPRRSAAAQRCLSELCERLRGLGWEEEGSTRGNAWYAMGFCRADSAARPPAAVAAEPVSAGLDPAFADAAPGDPEPAEAQLYVGQGQAGPVVPDLQPVPLALVDPGPVAAGVDPGVDGVGSPDSRPAKLELARPARWDAEPARPGVDREAVERSEFKPMPGPVEPWWRKPRPDRLPVEVVTELRTGDGAQTGTARRLTASLAVVRLPAVWAGAGERRWRIEIVVELGPGNAGRRPRRRGLRRSLARRRARPGAPAA